MLHGDTHTVILLTEAASVGKFLTYITRALGSKELHVCFVSKYDFWCFALGSCGPLTLLSHEAFISGSCPCCASCPFLHVPPCTVMAVSKVGQEVCPAVERDCDAQQSCGCHVKASRDHHSLVTGSALCGVTILALCICMRLLRFSAGVRRHLGQLDC